DDALEKLGESERNPVLLRFFEEKNHRQVGAALGISEEAAKKRVNRGLEKLRSFFTGRGFTISTAMLGSLMLAHAIKLPPAGLLESVVSATKISSTATSQALVSRAVNQMLRARLKWAALWCVGLLLSVALVSVGSRTFRRGSSSNPAASDPNLIGRVPSTKFTYSKPNLPEQ